MVLQPTDLASPQYDLSVIIPLYDKRVSENECFDSFCRRQTLPKQCYEVIAVSNGNSIEVDEKVKRSLTDNDRFLSLSGGNMTELYDLGARNARSCLLFFTELHCIAEPDCLEKLLAYLADHPVDGACVRSEPGAPNVFAQTEAELFEQFFKASRSIK